MKFSRFGHRYAGRTGTRELMEDLGAAMQSARPLCNLGGGNPAEIPELAALFRERLARLLEAGALDRTFSRYDDPKGLLAFREAVAGFFAEHYGWPLTAANVAITTGSQSSFFMLFNALAGRGEDGSWRRILLPLTPEYIGYADVPIEPDMLRSRRPVIEQLPGRQFKYRIDFSDLVVDDEVGAVCVSRPTNPTGNLLSDDEIRRLSDLALDAGVPLIIDNAYGLPFPNIVFGAATLTWAPHIILCMSLSKIGLPGLRTGIVVAAPEVVDFIGAMNAIATLSSNPVGAALGAELFRDGTLERISRDCIQPYYQRRVTQALEWCEEAFVDIDYRVHRPEGAIFLWLWFPGLPGGSHALYQRLKARDTLVLSGHHFFPGLAADDWPHRHECLRVSYARDEAQVRAGLGVIGEEVRKAFAGGP